MTEQEWLTCDDPQDMLVFLGKGVSSRKLRLFACACCRRIWPYLRGIGKTAVETSERYADKQARRKELIGAYGATTGLSHAELAAGWAAKLGKVSAPRLAAVFAAVASSPLVGPVEFAANDRIDPQLLPPHQEFAIEQCHQARLLRDIFGNPFRPVSFNAFGPTSTVTALAQPIYDERAFDRMPILADALEDAGCTDADILNHCRQPGEHVRGCWVVDLLLEKS